MRHAIATCMLLAASGCGSPVEDKLIESLGPELEGVAESEYHRPGQPCLACHGQYGGDGPIMSVGGTVFATPHDQIPVEGVTVRVTDARGQTETATSNCVGNFFIEESTWKPVFPLTVNITCPRVPTPKSMGSLIGRDGSCAHCHSGEASLDSPGWVYCAAAMPDPPFSADPACPGRVP